MGLEGVKWNISQKEKDKYCKFHSYLESKKQTKIEENKLLDTEIRLGVARGEEGHLYGDGWWPDL